MVLIFFCCCRQAVIITLGLYSLGWWLIFFFLSHWFSRLTHVRLGEFLSCIGIGLLG